MFSLFAEVLFISERTAALDTQTRQLQDIFDTRQQKYLCEACTKKFKTIGGLQRHLRKEHDWVFMEEVTNSSSKKDHIALYRASFMKYFLLLRDTNDAYKMGDGERILRNSKFQMLLSRIGNHVKYQLLLFRFMAYCFSLLTPRMAYEYIWNCTANLHGNLGHNIPNVNLVELLVQAVKKKVRAQGANATYESARSATLALQIQEEITHNMQEECKKGKGGTRRPEPSKGNDITAMVKELQSAEIFDYIPGREFSKFPGFSEVFSRVKVTDLHKWIRDNKERLSYETL